MKKIEDVMKEMALMTTQKRTNNNYSQEEHGGNQFACTHETQVSEGGEADLHKHFFKCKKNPGHNNFVHVNDFSIKHLPKGFYDDDRVDFIKVTADLTVRVVVTNTSTERPEFWPNTNQPYPFYDMRGSDAMRLGTGLFSRVCKWTDEHKDGTCKCQRCQHSDTPSKVWGEVRMTTARHVVFNDFEATHAACRLFFDKQDSPLVTLEGWTVEEENIEEDKCEMKCVTCDSDLLDKLVKMWLQWVVLWNKVHNKYIRFRDAETVTFIVSHPHGCPKQVSVGKWINRYELRDRRTRYTYTTCTCPGSSGAHVHSLGYKNLLYSDIHVHSGVDSNGRNFSSPGREFTLYQ